MFTIKKDKLYIGLIYIIILGGAFIDALTGYFTNSSYGGGASITPGIIFRGGIIIPLLALLAIKKKPPIILVISTGLFSIFLTLLYNLIIGGNYSIISNISFFLKVLYPFIGFLALKHIHENSVPIKLKTLWRIGFYYGFIVASGIILLTFSGFSIQSYAHQAYTSAGLYGAANDTGLVLIISFPLYLYYNQKYQSGSVVKLLFVSVIFIISALLISTRATLIGVPLSFFIVLGASLFVSDLNKKKSNKTLIAFVIVFFIVVGIKLIHYMIVNDMAYSLKRVQELASGEFTGRSRVSLGISEIYNFNLFEHLFGVGDKRFDLVENDIIDMYGKYGSLFFVTVFGASLFFLLRIYHNFFKSKSLASVSLSIALSYYFFHGSLAGHAFGSAQVNNLIMVVYFLIYLQVREQNFKEFTQ